MLNMKEFIQDFKTVYQETIKPNLEKGEYELSKFELYNSLDFMKRYSEEIILEHNGLSIFSMTRKLYEVLEEGNLEKISGTMRLLETYLGQNAMREEALERKRNNA